MRTANQQTDLAGAAPCLTKPQPSPILSGMTRTTLDLSGFRCPLPALKTRKALGLIKVGDQLEVHCTDPLAAIDIPNLINETGDHIELMERNGTRVTFLIERRKRHTG